LDEAQVALELTSQFPLLRSLSLNLTPFAYLTTLYECYVPTEFGRVAEASFRILTMLFEVMLTDRTVPLRELSLYGIPVRFRPSLDTRPQFDLVVRVARHLTLHFGKWSSQSAPIHTHPRKDHPSRQHPFDFVAFLQKGCLEAGQDKREKLDLSFDDYVGYYRKLNWRILHFPRLKELSLTGVTLTHNRQIRWITDHCSTLQKLRLVNCSIVLKVYTYMVFDKNHYPKPTESAVVSSTVRNSSKL